MFSNLVTSERKTKFRDSRAAIYHLPEHPWENEEAWTVPAWHSQDRGLKESLESYKERGMQSDLGLKASAMQHCDLGSPIRLPTIAS